MTVSTLLGTRDEHNSAALVFERHALASDDDGVRIIASQRTEADDDGSHKAKWGIFSAVSLQITFSMPRRSLGI